MAHPWLTAHALSSVEAYFPSDPTFLYNYAIARAAAGKYKEAEPALLALQGGASAEELSKDYIFQMWLARCLVMNGKARQAWEIYLKMEGTQESFAMLQVRRAPPHIPHTPSPESPSISRIQSPPESKPSLTP